jgi:hypothetical protein
MSGCRWEVGVVLPISLTDRYVLLTDIFDGDVVVALVPDSERVLIQLYLLPKIYGGSLG